MQGWLETAGILPYFKVENILARKKIKYKGGKYNILVTIYPSDENLKLKAYLNDKDHVVIPGEK